MFSLRISFRQKKTRKNPVKKGDGVFVPLPKDLQTLGKSYRILIRELGKR